MHIEDQITNFLVETGYIGGGEVVNVIPVVPAKVYDDAPESQNQVNLFPADQVWGE